MASHSTGTFVLPLPVFGGSDRESGAFYLPMFVMEGYMGARGEPFEIPMFVFSGTSISRAARESLPIWPLPGFPPRPRARSLFITG